MKSAFEFETYKAIKGLLPRGATIGYEDTKLNYSVPATYTPDLTIVFKDETVIYIETKGYFKYADRVKMISVRDSNPGLDIRLVFMRNSPSSLGKGSKMRPSEWAEKNGFKWACGEIPLDWFRKEND